MGNKNASIKGYFKRINYQGSTDVSVATFYGLHTAHALSIPFENLDVYHKKPILLDRASLYQKLVENRRGGYCFEMNGLFSFILQELGFNVTNLLARVTRDGESYSAKTHQVMMVEIDGQKWLADVGFGGNGIIAPIVLEENVEQKQFAQTYRIKRDAQLGYILEHKTENRFHAMYAFTLEECCPMDYVMSNHFTATFPESFFTTMKICTIPTKEGRITLTDMNLKILANGELTEITLGNEEEYLETLSTYFALQLKSA